MSVPDPFAAPPPPVGQPPTAARREASDGVVADLLAAGSVVAALGVIGIVLGVVWAAWSPPGPRALVLTPGVFVPDETESFIAGDGRFLVLSVAVGLLAGVFAWRRRQHRGPLVLLSLAVGGLGGASLMWWMGHLTGGGTYAGRPNTIIAELPLTLHAIGLLFLEGGVAVLVYGVLVAFAVADDLGRPDPVRDSLVPVSVGAGDHPQDGGGDGDAARALQQRDFPPQ